MEPIAPQTPPTSSAKPLLPPSAPGEPIRVIVEQPSSRGSRVLRRLVWIALVISLVANFSMAVAYQSYFQPEGVVEESFAWGNRDARDKVAIIEFDGLILGGDSTHARRQIDRVWQDASVKAVVLRVNSPGGTVSGSDYLHHHLKRLVTERNIPLVVSMGSIAASGGYYVAMAAGERPKTIFAEPTTWTGSIGVLIPHYDLTGLLDKIAVKDDSIASHPLKLMLSPTRKTPDVVSDEEMRIAQKLVDDSFGRFKSLVVAARPELRKNAAWQDSAFTGRIFAAPEAQQLGLVDQIGFLEDAVARAIELAGLSSSEVRVVRYLQPVTLSKLLLSKSPPPAFDAQAILDAATPRAYYICTWLPGMSTAEAR